MFTGKAVLLANPNFAKLYKKLTTQYLTSNGATKEVAKKFNDILKNNLANLWILNEEFKCHHEMKKNTIFINYFSGLIESIELKARVHLYETLREVYDDDTVKMLRTIRNNLLDEEQNKIQELTNLNNELLKYQNIKDFDDIIDNYIEINKEIKKIDDDIKRLKQ
ncbi:11637_t:CDS:2 [Entrophospora sp. SA101]|nr:11637_t:CDS:2 [Entrophospora sp. SA101]